MDQIPSADQYADVLRYSDFDQLKNQKRITHVLLADSEDTSLITQSEGSLPDDWLVGHHWPPKYIQDRFIELGVQIGSRDDCPVQVLTVFEHAKGRAGSIHTLMNDGPFPEAEGALGELYQTKQELMDALLNFVKNDPNEDVTKFAKPLRAWAQEHNIPFAQ